MINIAEGYPNGNRQTPFGLIFVEENESTFSILCSWYQTSIKSCIWFLKLLSGSHKHWVEKIFFHCYRPDIRILFTNLLEVIFQKSCHSERKDYYNLVSDGSQSEPDPYDEDSFDSDSEITVYVVNKECTVSR